MAFKQQGVKIGVIGTGFVGSTIAYTLMMGGLVSELVMVDIDKNRASGEAMDLRHGVSFLRPTNIVAGDYEDCAGADIVIITAGANQKPDETRLDLVKRNTEIFKDILPRLEPNLAEDSLLLVVSNPVDILAYVAWRLSDLPARRVIGSGTVLDSSRFRYLLSQHCGIDSRNIHGYIIGEHGDSKVAVWSGTNIAGVPFNEFCLKCDDQCAAECRESISQQVKQAAYEVIEKKGATYYAVALAVQKIVESLLRDENSILTVSTLREGEYGLNDLYLSLPTIINRDGVAEVIDIELAKEEEARLLDSARVLKTAIEELDL
ncbi:L-lactate dehydrogenase [Fuchsiella alkaliacetigena]|uniref:L-lactate dehydrogenase n=1 Tax=Fuchsiella alkaliacetigena TaxID=957042 RepID=UPI00200A0DB2|nr:L-lactate dehydrogenase [Fuchsiella alkaliacetigena]MCK8823568.1 L-lactate dehydrogenase [Fuchsiella alkaliacetigena]